jgi:ribokinase/sulfofructose kinase
MMSHHPHVRDVRNCVPTARTVDWPHCGRDVQLRLSPSWEAGRIDVVTLGENSLDVMAVMGPDQELAGKRRLSSLMLMPGGQAATAAVGCVRLGLTARYIGALGDDDWGSRVERGLRESGVEVAAVLHPGRSSRVAVILVDAHGERTVLEYRDPILRIDPVPHGAIEEGRVLLVDATDVAAARAAVDRARIAGIPSLVDVDRIVTGTQDLLRHIDVIIAPAPFVNEATGLPSLGAGLAALAAECPRASAVIATMGADGSLALANGRECRSHGFVVDVVDTTGAGDAFRAGFASAWVLLGAGAELENVLAFANATAALNCQQVGAQTGLPTREAVERLVTGSPDGRSK